MLYLEMCPYYESFIFFIILYCSGPGLSMTVYHTIDVVSGDVSIPKIVQNKIPHSASPMVITATVAPPCGRGGLDTLAYSMYSVL